MKFKLVENNEEFSFKELSEGGLSRIWQHTNDDSTFAIIGSRDKDTDKDRSDELIRLVSDLSAKNRGKIGYKPLFGRYQYKDGTVTEEISIIVFNIPKEKALEFAKKLNQESIIWKDKDFFGFLTPDGVEDGEFSSDPTRLNLSDEDIKLYGSRLARHKNKNQQKWFKFIMEQYIGEERSAVKNMATRPLKREQLFEIYYN